MVTQARYIGREPSSEMDCTDLYLQDSEVVDDLTAYVADFALSYFRPYLDEAFAEELVRARSKPEAAPFCTRRRMHRLIQEAAFIIVVDNHRNQIQLTSSISPTKVYDTHPSTRLCFLDGRRRRWYAERDVPKKILGVSQAAFDSLSRYVAQYKETEVEVVAPAVPPSINRGDSSTSLLHADERDAKRRYAPCCSRHNTYAIRRLAFGLLCCGALAGMTVYLTWKV